MRWAAIIMLFTTCCLVATTSAQGDVITYLRFEENGGQIASDETGLLDGELTAFFDTSPGGGDSGFHGWSTMVPSANVPLTGEANTSSMRFAGGSEFIDLSNGNGLPIGSEFTI